MSNNDNEDRPRTTPEKISLAVALLVLAAVVGSVVFLWVTSDDTPAQFEIARGEVRAEGEYFYLPVTVSNGGDATASQVTLEGSLVVDGEEETATTTFDFVPGNSAAEGVLIFGSDPTAAEVRVVSYQEP